MAVVVVAGLFWKASQMRGPTAPTAAGAPAPLAAAVLPISGVAAPQRFDTRKIELPKGSRVIDLRSDGERLILRIRHLGGNEQIQILHLGSGERLGVFEIESQE